LTKRNSRVWTNYTSDTRRFA